MRDFGPAILIHVIGSAAGTKILGLRSSGGGSKYMPLALILLVVSLSVLPFIGSLLAVSLIVVVVGLIL